MLQRKQQFQETMRVTSILITILFISCQGQANSVSTTNLEKEIAHDTSSVPSDSTVFYFPLKSFRDTAKGVGLDSFLVVWYSRQLFALREPVIYADKSQNEIYRFTWLRTFHHPVASRMAYPNLSGMYNRYWGKAHLKNHVHALLKDHQMMFPKRNQ